MNRGVHCYAPTFACCAQSQVTFCYVLLVYICVPTKIYRSQNSLHGSTWVSRRGRLYTRQTSTAGNGSCKTRHVP